MIFWFLCKQVLFLGDDDSNLSLANVLSSLSPSTMTLTLLWIVSMLLKKNLKKEMLKED